MSITLSVRRLSAKVEYLNIYFCFKTSFRSKSAILIQVVKYKSLLLDMPINHVDLTKLNGELLSQKMYLLYRRE